MRSIPSATGHPGAVVWLTGLPSSGKSTIARALYDALLARGVATELLDGSEVRESLSRGLGFTREDRDENTRRIGYVAKLLSRNGVVAICAAESPFRSSRGEVRRNVTNFVEVHVDCPVAVAEARDDGGLYARARRGEIAEFTGVNAPYEAPDAAEVIVRSDRELPDVAVERILGALEQMGILSAATLVRQSAQEEEIRRRLAAQGYS